MPGSFKRKPIIEEKKKKAESAKFSQVLTNTSAGKEYAKLTNDLTAERPPILSPTTSSLFKVSSFNASTAYQKRLKMMHQNTYSKKADQDDNVEVKVLKAFVRESYQPPRKVEIHRTRNLYQAQSIEKLLREKGIDYSAVKDPLDHKTKLPTFLPLEIFDNLEYEIREPAEWIALGKEKSSTNKCHIPGKALRRKQMDGMQYWMPCTVKGYDSEKKKFHVRYDDTEEETYVPRLQLMFNAENPFRFADRLAEAHTLRRKHEAYIRYSLYIDNMPVLDIPPIGREQVNRILRSALNNTNKDGLMETSTLLEEVNVEWKRTMNKIIFDDNLSLPEFRTLRNSPELESLDMNMLNSQKIVKSQSANNGRQSGTIKLPDYNFSLMRQQFSFHSFITRSEIIDSDQKINLKLLELNEMVMLNTVIAKSLRLEDFEQMQSVSMNNSFNYVRRNWMLGMKNTVVNSLRGVGKGWFNLRERSTEVYKFSKLRRYLLKITFEMEDYIRFMLESNLQEYHDFIKHACTSEITITSTSDFSVSYPEGFEPRKEPLFSIDLLLKENQIVPMTALEKFKDVPCELFARSLDLLQDIPRLETIIMEHLYNRGSDIPQMKTPRLTEPLMSKLHSNIRKELESALIPVEEFLGRFDKFNKLIKLDPATYVTKYFEKPRTAKEMKKELERHTVKRESVLQDIPKVADIGLFSVKCEVIRNSLSSKHQQIHELLLSSYCTIAREGCMMLTEGFNKIKRELQKPCDNVEALVEMREFVNTIPGAVAAYAEPIESALEKFVLLDGFNFKLEKHDFKARWMTYAWPKTIDDAVEAVNTTMTSERKKYYDAMTEQQRVFEGEILQCQEEINEFARYTDYSKVANVADKARDIQDRLNGFQQQAQTFNSKEVAFDVTPTDYKEVVSAQKKFDPYFMLWDNAATWVHSHKKFLTTPLQELEPTETEKSVENMRRLISKCSRAPSIKNNIEVLAIAKHVEDQIAEFKPYMPIIQALAQDGMRERHWNTLSDKLGFQLIPDKKLTLEYCIEERKLDEHITMLSKEGEKAAKEYQIELALDKMESEWKGVNFMIDPYKKTKTYRLLGADEVMTQLDEHRVTTQAMQFSAFKGPFEQRISDWDQKLSIISEVLDEWLAVQRNWLHLQPIFDSADIMKQLPVEGKKFNGVDRVWRQTMESCHRNPDVLTFADNESLLLKFQDASKILDQVQKGLSEYLNTKRKAFARFYFLSDDELLQILSQTKDVKAVQPHVKKCFENIKKLGFDDKLQIISMFSPQGEEFPFDTIVDPTKSQVEVWMGEVQTSMQKAVSKANLSSYEEYFELDRCEWVKKSYGQCVLTMSQVAWTQECEDALNESGTKGMLKYWADQKEQMQGMVEMVRGKLEKLTRIDVGALITLDVHNLNTVERMVKEGVATINDFTWISQLRYYVDEEELIQVKMVQAVFPYGYEYQGNSLRLVVTPLTERCYMTLMSALSLHLGGAPAGPAGTGKTETVKDLAKNVAKQCVVFNCSDSLDHLAMAKFFKGLAMAGAWACFDEFNRIDIEVLSVVAQQIASIWNAIKAKKKTFIFDEMEISLDPTCCVFITMNPGYAGRTELPDNLTALFRPVAMMVPDYALIAEIMLYSFGFETALPLSKKMVATFTLCSEQLSSQHHYDYGMRAVKTVIVQAGNLKKRYPEQDEDMLLLRALVDANLPKFLVQDLDLFAGIISDLFPGLVREETDYGLLLTSILITLEKKSLQRVQVFVDKVLQLYETTVVRHGLMLVGPTGGGKTCNLHTLRDSLTRLHMVEEFRNVHAHTVNPKSITMGQLYGQFDGITHEWTDGLLPIMVRACVEDTSMDKQWIVFDGPVDAIWIENMNTVLDDNKKLCLNSGEIIAISDEMNIIFEVEDLSVASPATVSRCGMVYYDPTALGLSPMLRSWLESLPSVFHNSRPALELMIDNFVEPAVILLRTKLTEPVPSVDNNVAASLCRIIDCMLAPYVQPDDVDEDSKIPDSVINEVNDAIQSVFIFALTWSFGATTNDAGRYVFDGWVRLLMQQHATKCTIPEDALVYDYKYDLTKKTWIPWMGTIEKFTFNPNSEYSSIITPTVDSIRYTFLLDILLTNNKHTLFTGNTGTGKTVNVNQYLQKINTRVYQPLVMIFSAATSENQVQEILDTRLDTKRRRGVFGPPLGKKCVLFIDDVNMPEREEYFAQPPIEFLRQWLDHGGWFKKVPLYAFCTIQDIIMVGAMGPPGGGRNPITSRFVRHFNQIAHTDLSYDSLYAIFHTILKGKLQSYEEEIQEAVPAIVKATIQSYFSTLENLLPTPARSHYTFNLRDLSKVHQGLLSVGSKNVPDLQTMLQLWIHENRRVFGDRLIDDIDRTWYDKLLSEQIKTHFGLNWDGLVPTDRRLLFGDFMGGAGSEDKLYKKIVDMEKLQQIVDEFLEEYNADPDTSVPMNLVLFLDAIEHVSRISRVLRQPQGNALLLGVGGSGRQSLSTLASFMGEFDIFRIELSKNYGKNEWRDDLKKVLLQAGLEQKPTVFLFVDTQIIMESFLEDINNILSSGSVPGIYLKEDLDKITDVCKIDCTRAKMEPTKLNIYGQYINRVRRNLHIVLCMSPIGDLFRTRLRMFPSLVNCCTIDWFSAWPAEALQAVAHQKLQEDSDVTLDEPNLTKVVDMFVKIHQTVEVKSKEYAALMGRFSYVTPTSYLELLSTFRDVLKFKRIQVKDARDKLANGVQKLKESEVVVADLREKLKKMQPVLIRTQKEVGEMMEKIGIDKAAAQVTKEQVAVQEKEAQGKADECAAIKADAEADLAKALPALKAATQFLKELKKADIDEVRAFRNPPGGVVLTMEVICIILGKKPVRKKDTNMKVYFDYWEVAKTKVLNDAKGFMDTLLNFDKDAISEKTIKAMGPHIENPEFHPKMIEKASKACKAVCMWSHAMYTYYHVSREVEPKRLKLAAATSRLKIVEDQLKEAQDTLKGIMDRLQKLEDDFKKANGEKERLAREVELCEIKMDRAGKLIGGLGGEKVRWIETVENLERQMDNLFGDVVVSSGTIAYLGAYIGDYRTALCQQWREHLVKISLQHTANVDLSVTLGDQVKIRAWKICGLPTDTVSIENGIIIDRSARWPLMIDPQNQANKFTKKLAGEESVNGFDVVKLSEGKNFTRKLEAAIRFGKWIILENIFESLDPQLEPILSRAVFSIKGQMHIKLGDSTIPYSDDFRFFMTTKLPNPHYPPELQVKVTLLNFTVTRSGLQDQMLGLVVAKEAPDLEIKKNELVVSNAKMKKQLKEIEDKILKLLKESEGDILEDEVLIDTLSESKKMSGVIKEKVAEQEVVEAEIDTAREGYIPVAFRAAILYFVVSDMSPVDPMYQFSLQWFIGLFEQGITNALAADDLQERLQNINNSFTLSLYKNICRSMFEKHKMLFSFLLTVKIMEGDGKVDPAIYRHLVTVGHVVKNMLTNPTDWLGEKTWNAVCALGSIPGWDELPKDFVENMDVVKAFYDSSTPHRMPLPEPWESKLSMFQKLLVLRALRADKMLLAIQDWVTKRMGKNFVEPPPFNMLESYNISKLETALIFILTSGADPYSELLELAKSQGQLDNLLSISLGMGQGPIADRYIKTNLERGGWVVLQNCHLCVSWLPALEKICEDIESTKDNHNINFRLWLTSMPSTKFPVPILQNGVKMTNEPPKGLRANLQRSYLGFTDEFLDDSSKPAAYRKLMFGLCMYHAVILDRRKYGPLGWNIQYRFRESDLRVCITQLHDFLEMFEEIPFKVIHFLIYDVNYGGRVTDDIDRRTSKVILDDFITPKILSDEYVFSPSGKYRSIPVTSVEGYLEYIRGFELVPEPEIFGFHENADITQMTQEADAMFSCLTQLLPKTAIGGGKTKEEILMEQAQVIQKKTPKLIDIENLQKMYPTAYEESMNTVLVQEAIRYNKLLVVMNKSLADLQKAIKGLMVMTKELDAMGTSLYNNITPPDWQAVAYPSLKPLASWVQDLVERMDFIVTWIKDGIPKIFWISGFFFPQAFLTGTKQNFARKYINPIDTISFGFGCKKEKPEEIVEPPNDGCYIKGLYLEGCRWNWEQWVLDDSKPKELFIEMPVIWLLPQQNREKPESGIYTCPVYKILTRQGQLSTTGHSTNFVFFLELPSKDPERKWIKAGVAMFCSLNY